MLKLYGFARVNSIARGNTRDLRVLWALEEMQLPFEIVGIDHPAHDLNSASYRALNQFEQVPVIDDDGVVVSESGAILLYLAKRAGKLIPGDAAGEAQVTRWCFAAMNTVEIPTMMVMMIDWSDPKKEATGPRAFLRGWATRHLGGLDRWLEGREFIATDSFTVADILMAHVLAGVKDDSLIAPFPNVGAYRERCLARPAWRTTLARYYERVEAA